MKEIGDRIRNLRKKSGMTQTQLAEQLGVTYQTVSKWEKGENAPDLAMFPPLTRILDVSADYLLGLDTSSAEKRRQELQERYIRLCSEHKYEERLLVIRQLVREFPNTGLYELWAAASENFMAEEIYNQCQGKDLPPRYTDLLESAVQRAKKLIADPEQEQHHIAALHNLMNALRRLKRFDEVRRYARYLPPDERAAMLMLIAEGEEKKKLMQQQLHSAMQSFLNWLPNTFALLTIEIVETVIPDGNVLAFHNVLFNAWEALGFQYAEAGEYEKAVDALSHSCFHWMECKRLNGKKDLHYTVPIFSQVDNINILSGKSTPEEYRGSLMRAETLVPLHDREDFQAVMDTLSSAFL